MQNEKELKKVEKLIIRQQTGSKIKAKKTFDQRIKTCCDNADLILKKYYKQHMKQTKKNLQKFSKTPDILNNNNNKNNSLQNQLLQKRQLNNINKDKSMLQINNSYQNIRLQNSNQKR